MATRKTTALATRKSTPVVSSTHQPSTKPRHSQRGRNRKLSKLDEIGSVALDIVLGRGSEDHGSEKFLEKMLSVSNSTGMNDLFDQFILEFGEWDDVNGHKDRIAFSSFTATLLEAVKRCVIE
jgi:hypothetical protein